MLKVFQRAALNLSITKASNELFITQPAITKHIKELKPDFEVKLFDRFGNKITLTNAGSILLSFIEPIFSLHYELKFELSQLSEIFEGNLRTGGGVTLSL